jgi:hypothetical protein
MTPSIVAVDESVLALIDHAERTLNGAEIDQCISDTLNREARQAEIERRADWVRFLENSTNFVAGLES